MRLITGPIFHPASRWSRVPPTGHARAARGSAQSWTAIAVRGARVDNRVRDNSGCVRKRDQFLHNPKRCVAKIGKARPPEDPDHRKLELQEDIESVHAQLRGLKVVIERKQTRASLALQATRDKYDSIHQEMKVLQGVSIARCARERRPDPNHNLTS